ncbi:uncharacterized protein LOC127865910 isoform X2 [Dreissena polymorpha]|uniref:uncharacterized protein LOC127865910 isoform X2 n=1 Tax=Dreissena polymorpha TaxID=45954 RepID=UPI002265267B|nr:uncharacterized protein LOC127865910 isoform X2 [Dreissena polymorpha]
MITPSNSKKSLSTRQSSFTSKPGISLIQKAEAKGSHIGVKSNENKKDRKSVPVNGEGVQKERPQYDTDVTKNFNDMIDGDLSNVPALPKSMVRIFLSSTFSDFRAERNTLAREVYPYLRDYCTARDLDFQVVDMRWGVTEDSQNDHSVEKLCLLEVDNCQKSSLGPNFIVLSGDRYGFRPIPVELDVKQFEVLRFEATKLDLKDRALLDEWYKLDENAVPSIYLLQPIRSKFTFYADFSPGCSEVRKRDTEEWNKTYEALQGVLRKAALEVFKQNKISSQQKEQFFISVTECEIQDGILNASDVNSHCLVYKRQFNGVDDKALADAQASRFMEIKTTDKGPAIDGEVQTLRTDLFEKKIKSKLKDSNIHTYTLAWTPQGVSPEQSTQHKDYLARFCKDFIKDCTHLIDIAWQEVSQIPIKLSNYYSDYVETIHHLSFCNMKCESFAGQEEVLDKARAYILNDFIKTPLIIHAESGVGKTSIMAMIMKSIPKWLKDKSHTRLIRFLGTSPNTLNIFDVLFSVLGQVSDSYDMIIPPLNYKSMAALQAFIPRYLRQIATTAKEPVIILLDSIDQLTAQNDAYLMKWLPTMVPQNVKLIVSMLPNEHDILQNCKKLLPNSECYVEVPMLPERTGQEIMKMYLSKRKRKITDKQMTLLLSVFREAPSPLFLKLLLDEARVWKSYTPMEDIVLSPSVKQAINKLFEKLEKKFGVILVSHALGYITVGLAGLTEFEIEDVLSCDDDVLNDVYRYHDPPVPGIVRIPPVLWARIRYDIKEYIVERMSYGRTTLNWYHRQFIETASERYTSDGKDIALHRNLALLFLQEHGLKRTVILKNRNNLEISDADRQVTPQPFTPKNCRKLACLPYHASKAFSTLGREFVKTNILCNFQYLCMRIAAFSVPSVLQDLNEFLNKTDDDEVLLLQQFLQVSKENLTQPVRMAFSILSSLNPQSNMACLNKLVDDAKAFLESQTVPLLIPSFPCLAPRRDASSAVLASVSDVTEILDYCSDSVLLKVRVSEDQKEYRSPYVLFNTATQESDYLGIVNGKDIGSQLYYNGNHVFYGTSSAVVCFNAKTKSTDECPFKEIVSDWSESQIPVFLAFNKENNYGAVMFPDIIIVISIPSLTFSQSFVTGKMLTRFKSCLILNDSKIIAIGVQENSSAVDSQGPENQHFICLFNFGKREPIASYFTDKQMDLMMQAFAGSEETYAIAVKTQRNNDEQGPDGRAASGFKTEILLFDAGNLKQLKSFEFDGEVLQIEGNPMKSEFKVLTTDGFMRSLNRSNETKFPVKSSVKMFTTLWEKGLVLLCSGQGMINLCNSDGQLVGVFPAYSVAIKNIKINDQLVTLSSNCELKLWSVDALMSVVKQAEDTASNESASLLGQLDVTAMEVSLDDKLIFICKEDNTMQIWDSEAFQLRSKFQMGLTGSLLHPLNNSIIVHDTTLGKLKVFDLTGKCLFEPPTSVQNVMFSELNSSRKTLYLISAIKKGKEQIDEINMDLMQYVKCIKFQQSLTYESLDFKLSEGDRYLIIRSKISEQEFDSFKATWKKGWWGEQNCRFKFHAVDLKQGNGALVPCLRILSKIPTLGIGYLPMGPSTVLITTRRWVVFWDIPTGKCDQRMCKETKEPMFYLPTWCGGDQCTGQTSVMETDTQRSLLAVGSDDGYVMVYNVATGVPADKKKPATKHTGKVQKIAISLNGKWLASACSDNVLKLWDLGTYRELFSVGLDASVQRLAFNSASTRLLLYTGHETTRIMVFDGIRTNPLPDKNPPVLFIGDGQGVKKKKKILP